MDTQTTIRLPRRLADALDRLARERGVPKSQLIREALDRYLAEPVGPAPDRVRERSAPYLGALALDHGRSDADPEARLIRSRNWRP